MQARGVIAGLCLAATITVVTTEARLNNCNGKYYRFFITYYNDEIVDVHEEETILPDCLEWWQPVGNVLSPDDLRWFYEETEGFQCDGFQTPRSASAPRSQRIPESP